MGELNNDPRVLHGQIKDYVQSQREQQTSKAPLERPQAMNDPKATLEQKTAAEQDYASALLQRKLLTETEQRWLAGQVNRALHERE